MSRSARYAVVEDTAERLVLQDLGPWDKHLSITNDAENVVEGVAVRLKGRRLFYYDTDSKLTELIVDQDFGKFIRFGFPA